METGGWRPPVRSEVVLPWEPDQEENGEREAGREGKGGRGGEEEGEGGQRGKTGTACQVGGIFNEDAEYFFLLILLYCKSFFFINYKSPD